MIFLGRKVIVTTLDDIPRLFRCVPGYLALNAAEIAALERNDGDTFKHIAEIVKAEDMADALLQMRPKPRRRKKANLSPSTRMAMLHAVYGRDHAA